MTEFTEQDLVAALRPIEPYLGDLVVCGGWTLFIYRKWVLKDEGPRPMSTMDIDFAVPARVGVHDRPIDELLKEAGFQTKFIGLDDPAVMYVKDGAPEIEFLTPRKGNREPKTVQIQPGLQAEPLRYLEVVLEDTRSVEIPDAGIRVRVPSPEAYFYQKGLTFPKRASEVKEAKDLAYLFELLCNYPELAKDLPAGIRRLRDRHPRTWFTTFKGNLDRYFPDVDGEGPRLVVGQRPHPHDEMVMKDVTNGPGLFRQLVFATFRDFLEKV